VQLTQSYARALEQARVFHGDQVRKGGQIPYISHLLAVSAIVLEHGGTETEAIAGLLHDAIEDAGGPIARATIVTGFGEGVAEIVDGCTDDDPLPGKAKRPWRDLKESYIAHIAGATPSVLLVSAADKLHNARAIVDDVLECGPAVWGRFNATPGDIHWYYDNLVREMRTRLDALSGSGSIDEISARHLRRLLGKVARAAEDMEALLPTVLS
jgi:GTP pyrophosphokinase